MSNIKKKKQEKNKKQKCNMDLFNSVDDFIRAYKLLANSAMIALRPNVNRLSDAVKSDSFILTNDN